MLIVALGEGLCFPPLVSSFSMEYVSLPYGMCKSSPQNSVSVSPVPRAGCLPRAGVSDGQPRGHGAPLSL